MSCAYLYLTVIFSLILLTKSNNFEECLRKKCIISYLTYTSDSQKLSEELDMCALACSINQGQNFIFPDRKGTGSLN